MTRHTKLRLSMLTRSNFQTAQNYHFLILASSICMCCMCKSWL